MTEVEDRVLAHVGLYQISFAQVIEQRFLNNEPCGHLMNRLAEQRRVRIRKGLPGGCPKYYQLTRAELNRRGLPDWRSKRPKSQAFPTAISILWFCNMLDRERHLLEAETTQRLFPKGLPDGTHCIERSDAGHCLYRIRFTTPEADPNNQCLMRSLRKRVSHAFTFPGLRPWVSSGRYAFAILTECDNHAQRIRDKIAEDELLSSIGTVVVETTPGLHTLKGRLQAQTAGACPAARKLQSSFEWPD